MVSKAKGHAMMEPTMEAGLESGSGTKPNVVDAHVHLYDGRQNTHKFLEEPDAMFEALIGDYSSLPRVFGLNDYRRMNPQVNISGIVWHEFLSADPVREARWAQRLADSSDTPIAIVALVDFLAADLEQTLDQYESCSRVTAVRQHLGWDALRIDRRFARTGDLLQNQNWRRGLQQLRGRRFHCSLEVFSPQLPDLLPVIESNPDTGFTVAVMGWPANTEKETFRQWRSDLGRLSAYPNVQIIASGFECVFGMDWVLADAQPWVDAVFEIFGFERIMFGTHSPIAQLASQVHAPYDSCLALTASRTQAERNAVLHENAINWFFAGVV